MCGGGDGIIIAIMYILLLKIIINHLGHQEGKIYVHTCSYMVGEGGLRSVINLGIHM